MKILCGGHEHEVDLKGGGSGLQATVDGAAVAVRVEDAGGGLRVVHDGDAREVVHCVRAGDAVHLFWRGAAYLLQEETEDYRAAHRHHGGGLEAPMPGKVIAVKVAAGDAVTRGQELVVVEAMKMENAVRAPRDGRVAAVKAKVGDAVAPGMVLVEMEA
jgi:3-methylcrotonyl-CoA carboxylase alpha subunit